MTTKEKEYDLYLMEVYKQACENSRMYAKSRFSNLSAFLTYLSFLIAALAFVSSSKGSFISSKPVGLFISGLGIAITFMFFALEVRHHNYWKYYEGVIVKGLEQEMGVKQYPDEAQFHRKRDWISKGLFGIKATQATYSIYIFSIIFFIAMFIMFII